MKKILNILIVLGVILSISSCDEEFLERKPLDQYSDADVWSDPALVETFVNNMYRNVLGFPHAVERLSDFTDESFFMHWGIITSFNQSLITPDDLLGWFGTWENPHQTRHLLWNPLYANVRRTNIFFDQKDNLSNDNPDFNNRLIGEAYFLRAYTYHFLTTLYGGVPIINKVFDLDDDFKVARNSYQECIDFIVGQCDSAIMYLPETYPGSMLGRATKGAALTLKSRVLLYAASDLHNPDKNNEVASGYSNPELLGYTSGDATARWTAAKDAAKAVIDLNQYSLFKSNPAPTDSVAENFVEFFISRGTNEDILLHHFTPKTDEDWQGYDPGRYTGSNGYHGWGCNTPIGDLVDDYEMKDGSKFDWSNPGHAASPYSNRDARLYATVLYDGAEWRQRPSDAALIDPFNIIQTGNVCDLSGNTLYPGLDTRNGPIENWNGTKTGYYLRKFIDPTVDAQFVKQDIPFKNMRYAEVLLNYAEACSELGIDGEARTYINMIRKRAGQPEISASVSGDELKEAIRHERRIELAFEDFRIWDVRRWMIADEITKQTTAIAVKYSVETTSDDSDFSKFFVAPSGYSGSRSDKYRKSDGSTWGMASYTTIDTPGDSRMWDNKMYFWPIMRDEMNKNDLLIQNPGY